MQFRAFGMSLLCLLRLQFRPLSFYAPVRAARSLYFFLRGTASYPARIANSGICIEQIGGTLVADMPNCVKWLLPADLAGPRGPDLAED